VMAGDGWGCDVASCSLMFPAEARASVVVIRAPISSIRTHSDREREPNSASTNGKYRRGASGIDRDDDLAR
jgi:hypothetical protein